MSAEDTANYIKQQIDLFEIMRRDSERALEAKQEHWASVRQSAIQNRARIRRLRTELTQREDSPSMEDVATSVLRRQQIDRLTHIQEAFFALQGELSRLSDSVREARAALAQLPNERLTDDDIRKLQALQESFISQLRAYDFGSFSDERLAISREDYLPRRDDFDLQADISASDSIRVVWAYLLGLLDVSKRADTNHPGFLLFDEPRQQSAKDVSFRALLDRASQVAEDGQIVFATSENLDSLREMTADLACELHVVDGYLLKRIN